MKANKRLPDEKIISAKNALKSGVSIREAARIANISYYSAWHVSKGSYDQDSFLSERFKKKSNSEYFDWEKQDYII